MKKKLLFVLNYMGGGGVAKALINLLKYTEKFKEEYEVDLFLFKKTGAYLEDIPQHVNILDENELMSMFAVSLKESKQYGKLFFIKRFITAIWTKLFSNKLPLKIASKNVNLNKSYDLAVAFSHTKNSHVMLCGCPEFILYGVNAKRKCMLIHGDVIAEKILNNHNIKVYKKLDKLLSVSKSCSNQLKRICPKLRDKSDYLYNIQLTDEIINKSKEHEINFDKSKFNIISVSRLSEEKAHIRSLKVMKRLKDEGFDFNWHILGDGAERENIEKCIKENKLEDCVKLYGNQSNPYPYIKSADLFYLGSYHEAAPMVYAESMTLGVPVITTETCSAKELVGEKGFVCENSEEGIYNSLKDILTNKKTLEEKRKSLKDYSYDNDAIIKKLTNLID